MNFENLMINRRSIREYDSRPVTGKEIEKVINAGRWAPTAGNSQAVRYIVVRKREFKKNLAVAAYYQKWMESAGAMIVVCVKSDILEAKYADMAYRYAMCDGAAAVQNMLLMATDLGLGSCWVGAFDSEKVRTYLKIPPQVKIVGIVTLGHYSKSARIPLRKGLNELIYLEEWEKK